MKLYKLIPILFALIYKYSISYSSYSGEATPPLFGDFEAQRHWMEITLHLPIQSWYSYDLEYWGLDYPPLTAYHSLVFGIIGNWIEKSWFALDISRGIEDAGLKIYMRITSIVTDFAILVPAIYLYRKGKMDKFTLLLLVIPGVALIDHGHFQYNSAMLGFSLLSFHYILEEHFMIGSFFFVCSLLFKQMALFYSLPVFIYLLSKSMADFKFNGYDLLIGSSSCVRLVSP